VRGLRSSSDLAARLRAGALALPRPRAPAWRLDIAAARPSRRSILGGLALAALAGGGYLFARYTGAFAVAHVEVQGGTPVLRAQVRHELAPLKGTSLLALHGAQVAQRVDALPALVSASYDRAFPHTLRVTIVPERTAAVLHRGRQTWLVSRRGRVLRPVAPFTHARLPRIWLPRAASVAVGELLDPTGGRVQAQAAALARQLPAHVDSVVLQHGELVLRLRSGLALMLGEPSDLRLKLAVARLALPRLPSGSVYLDVSVPGRPVAGTEASLATPTTTTEATTAAVMTATTATTTATNPQVSTRG
jgi:cell division protein FtsQ